MYEDALKNAGLTRTQAVVYEALIKTGEKPAGDVSKICGLKRGITYKALEELVKLGLAVKNIKTAVLRFSPAHPSMLIERADSKIQSAQNAKDSLSAILGDLSSSYNLASKMPGVNFYEGLKGIKEVLDDSLSAKMEICTYGDLEMIFKYIKDINEAYVARREKLGIKKRGIALDTPFTRNFLANYHREITDTRLIKAATAPFSSIMQIYDDKISYITLTPDKMIGVIVHDKSIYEMHKYLFEFTWDKAEILVMPAEENSKDISDEDNLITD